MESASSLLRRTTPPVCGTLRLLKQNIPDGTRILTSSPDKTVRLWDARTGQAVEAIPEQILRNKAIIHRYFEEWVNRGNAAVADELIATNLVLRNPPAVIRGLDDYKTGMAKFHTQRQNADGDGHQHLGVGRWKESGNHGQPRAAEPARN